MNIDKFLAQVPKGKEVEEMDRRQKRARIEEEKQEEQEETATSRLDEMDGDDEDEQARILRLLDEEPAGEEFDVNAMKRQMTSLEKKVTKNQEMRVKYADQPTKFLESEIELHEEIQKAQVLATAPELLPDLIATGCIGLICDSREEGVAFIDALMEADFLELLMQNLERLDETVREDADCVHNTLGLIENLCALKPGIFKPVFHNAKLRQWLKFRLKQKVFDANKLYAAEILAILLQQGEENWKLFGEEEGLDMLLRFLAFYRNRDPKSSEEIELMNNYFDALCSCLMRSDNKTKFLQGEGIELMIIMLSKHGACIQCNVKPCCTAYHATCAMKVGLYMRLGLLEDSKTGTTRSVSYCDLHAPSDWQPCILDAATLRQEMQESLNSAPVMSIPLVAESTAHDLLVNCGLRNPEKWTGPLLAYWMLKRQSRSGVPLIRRLQKAAKPKEEDKRVIIRDSAECNALKAKVKTLREGLEKTKLLTELVMKRERSRRDLLRVQRQMMDIKVKPLVLVLRKALYQLRRLDQRGLFLEPVNTEEVTDYADIIKNPLDFGTMNEKLGRMEYTAFGQFYKDFILVCNNALIYNDSETIYYREAVLMFHRGEKVLQDARASLQGIMIDPLSGLMTPSGTEGEDAAYLSPAIVQEVEEIRRHIPPLDKVAVSLRCHTARKEPPRKVASTPPRKVSHSLDDRQVRTQLKANSRPHNTIKR
eukprot:Ihof_evm2s810 gene=Ihof_evmTU2s810